MAKKNIRKIPKSILRQLEHLKDERYIVVACLRVYSSHDLLGESALEHLNVHLGGNELSMPEDSVLPPESSGKHSFRNINGHEVIRKDLPKETRYNAVESPNWGDSYNGTHTETVEKSP